MSETKPNTPAPGSPLPAAKPTVPSVPNANGASHFAIVPALTEERKKQIREHYQSSAAKSEVLAIFRKHATPAERAFIEELAKS